MPVGIKGNDIIAYATGGALVSVYIPPAREDMESIMMLNSPSSVIAEYITTVLTSLGLTPPNSKSTWPLYIGELPDGTQVETNAVSIRDTAGLLDGRFMASGQVVQHFGLQIKLRANDYETGWTKIESVAISLDGIPSETPIIKDGTTYSILNMSRSSAVINLGLDDKKRNSYSVNYLLTIREEV